MSALSLARQGRSFARRAIRKIGRTLFEVGAEADDSLVQTIGGKIKEYDRSSGEPITFTTVPSGIRFEFRGSKAGQTQLSVRVFSATEPEPQQVSIRCLNGVGTLLTEATVELRAGGPIPFVRSEQGLHPLAFLLAFRLEGWFEVPLDAHVILVDGPNNLGPDALLAHQTARVEQGARFSGPRFSSATHLRIRSDDQIKCVSRLPGGREGGEYYQLLLPAVIGSSSGLLRTRTFDKEATELPAGPHNAVDRDQRILHAIARGRSVDRSGRTTKAFGLHDKADHLTCELSLFLTDSMAYFDLKRWQGRWRDPYREHSEVTEIADADIAVELSQQALAESNERFLRLFL